MNWSKHWSLEIEFELDDGSTFSIPYFLYESPYLPLWINQWRLYLERNNGFYFWLINKTEEDFPELCDKLQELIQVINSSEEIKIPTLEKNFNQDQFNEFHRTFEERCHAVDENLNHRYMELNVLIHTIETIFSNKDKQLFRTIIGVLGLEEALPLKPEYQLFSNHNISWGDLTMSYATTGKSWAEVNLTNDLVTLENNAITNKSLIRQEFITHFELMHDNDLTLRFGQLERFSSFYNWYSNLPSLLKQNVPIDNLNELSFRDLFLGSIDIKNIDGIDYYRYIESTSYRQSFRKNFNTQIIKKIKNVHSLHFINKLRNKLSFKVTT